MPEYAWPPAAERRLLGKRIARLDGPGKVTGTVKYTYDLQPEGMLHGRILHCPHAHARVRRLDVSRAEGMAGVRALRVIHPEGSEIRWAMDEVLYLAADSEQIAADALAAVVVEYEVLPHFVDAEDRDGAPETRDDEEEVVGDPAAALAGAAHRHVGEYGLPTVAHNCLEAHGQVCSWEGDELTAWCSTQAVSALPAQFAERLGVPAANVRVRTEVLGGGFGSKFSVDRWGIECAELARAAGRPVKLMLEREPELTIAGDRPSAYARVELAADAEGRLVGWSSESWGSGGLAGSGSPPLPYVFAVPDRRHRHVSVPTHVAGSRAWRAPNHPQACFITLAALEDLAAAAGLDPLELVRRNLHLTGRLERIYRDELEIADRLMGWSRRWRPRPARREVGRWADGPRRRGLGLSVHTWGGRGHRSNCALTLHPDGGVDVRIATQDLGTGTRTAVAIVAAETLGLPLAAVRVHLGDSRFPASGASGGSTTIGGVASSTRRAAQNLLEDLFRRVAPQLEAGADELEARDGRVGVAGDPDRSMPWKRAAALAGPSPLVATGANPGPGELTESGVGGVQMAEVTVDTETGVVRVEKMVAVQDCGLIVDLETAESQVYGGLIMGISTALAEEKVIDPVTGRMLNVDFESYKLAGIADVGELVVHMMTGPGYDDRGAIGLGEPPVISPGAAISNAVANALGVRVPYLPLTPDRVLAALEDAVRAPATAGGSGGSA
ncbi:MAG TPA: xanthine dehydrogenase family protein molybdopterin-binding subunit [Thermoanaerobaculia bacterium]|nr:xanthine dehydrogenase family protein molybdopterin-binding subunit [Thermoanaerobaculia bacterium]